MYALLNSTSNEINRIKENVVKELMNIPIAWRSNLLTINGSYFYPSIWKVLAIGVQNETPTSAVSWALLSLAPSPHIAI